MASPLRTGRRSRLWRTRTHHRPGERAVSLRRGVYAFGLYGTRLAVVSGVVGLLALAAIGGSLWLLTRV